jgi:hypothetical protein
MRDITAQLESYQDHLDAMYPAVTSDELDSVYIESEAGRVRAPHPAWRRAFAFGSAFVLILGLGVIGFLLGGRQAVELANDVAPTVVSTVPPSRSATPDTTIEPVAPPTTVLSTPLPSTTPESPSATVPAAVLADGFTWQTYFVIDPDGGFAAAFFSEVDDAVKLMRCPDLSCTESSAIVVPGTGSVPDEQHGELAPVIEDLALRPDGSPIVIVSTMESSTIHACADPDCASIETAVFGESEEVAVGTPRLAVAEDGLLRIAYADFDARSLKLAVCEDPLCESRSAVTIHDDILIPGETSIHIEDDGRLFVGYEIMREGQLFTATIAVCTDDACSTEPAISTFEDAVKPRWTMIDDEAFLTWYRSGPEIVAEGDLDVSAMLDAWDLMVAECDTAGCGEARQIEVGWELLQAWGGFSTDLRLLQTPSGQVVAIYGYWSPDHCAQLLKVVTLEPQAGTMGTELGTYVGGPFSVSVTSDTELLLAYQGAEGEVHIVEIPTTAPGPAESGLPLADACPTP